MTIVGMGCFSENNIIVTDTVVSKIGLNEECQFSRHDDKILVGDKIGMTYCGDGNPIGVLNKIFNTENFSESDIDTISDLVLKELNSQNIPGKDDSFANFYFVNNIQNENINYTKIFWDKDKKWVRTYSYRIPQKNVLYVDRVLGPAKRISFQMNPNESFEEQIRTELITVWNELSLRDYNLADNMFTSLRITSTSFQRILLPDISKLLHIQFFSKT